MNLLDYIAIALEIVAFVGVIVPYLVKMSKIAKGTMCQLRSEMLQIYYRHHKDGVIRQYEYENFVMLYEAYKSLGGNSFIDKIYKEVQTWEIVS